MSRFDRIEKTNCLFRLANAAFIALLIGVGLPSWSTHVAHAQDAADVQLTWDCPTTRTDGTALLIRDTRVLWKLATEPAFREATVPGCPSSYTFTGLTAGEWIFGLKVIAQNGDMGPEATITFTHDGSGPFIPHPYPNAATGLAAEMLIEQLQPVNCAELTVQVNCRLGN